MTIPPNRNIGDSGHVNDHNDIAAQLLASPPIGSVMAYAAASAPTGYLLCQGQNVSRTTYAALFAVIGTTYGVGDGSTTFGLPNLKGRIPVGLDSAQTEFDTLNESGGAKTHTLITSEIPSHDHSTPAHVHTLGMRDTDAAGTNGVVAGQATFDSQDAVRSSGGGTSGSTGGGGAHNNLQPYLVLNYIIRAT